MKKLVYRVGPNCRHGRCKKGSKCDCELNHNRTLCGTEEIEKHTPHRHDECDCTLYARTCFEAADGAVTGIMRALSDEKPNKRERVQMLLAKVIQDTVDTAEGMDRPNARMELPEEIMGEKRLFEIEGEHDCVFRGTLTYDARGPLLAFDARVGPIVWKTVLFPQDELRKLFGFEEDKPDG